MILFTSVGYLALAFLLFAICAFYVVTIHVWANRRYPINVWVRGVLVGFALGYMVYLMLTNNPISHLC